MKTIKKLEGQRWFIWTILFLVVSLIGLATYVWVAAELDNTQTEVFSIHKTTLTQVNGERPEIPFVIQRPYKDTDYVRLTGGASTDVLNVINEKIRSDVIGTSCYGDPSDPTALSDLRSMYEDQANSALERDSTYKKVDVSKLNFVQLRQKIINDFNFDSTINTTVLYAKNNIFSLQVDYDEFCGGAHPDYGSFGETYNLETGNLMSFSSLFKNYKVNSKGIKNIIVNAAESVDDQGCNYAAPYGEQIDYSQSDDPISYAITEKGLKIVSVGFPYAEEACEPNNLIIPFSEFNKYLNADSPFLLSSADLKDKEGKILSRVKQALVVNNLFQIPNDCINFSLDSSTSPDYYFVDLRENHTNPKCGGDLNTAPFLVTFRISKSTGKMATDYGSANGEFSPISEELLEADFINTSWIPDDGTDAVLSFLSTKKNEPTREHYDFKLYADSRLQEVGFWEIKDGKIIPTVSQVFATPQELTSIEPMSGGLLIRTPQLPEGFKLIKYK